MEYMVISWSNCFTFIQMTETIYKLVPQLISYCHRHLTIVKTTNATEPFLWYRSRTVINNSPLCNYSATSFQQLTPKRYIRKPTTNPIFTIFETSLIIKLKNTIYKKYKNRTRGKAT